MNPFGNISSTHSTWLVVLSIMNLPSYLCMKQKYLMLAILIQGPRQLRTNIDVFLEPLLEDMVKTVEPFWVVSKDMERDVFMSADEASDKRISRYMPWSYIS